MEFPTSVSTDRRQQQRGQGRRQRREARLRARQNVPQPRIGQVEFTGPMGFMQRHIREFFIGGIVVMVLSLGGIFFSTQGGTPQPVAPGPTLSPEPAARATATATEPEDAVVRRYDAAPALTIDPEGTYEAVLELATGEVRIVLDAAEAPIYVNNFVFLARNGFYDGLIFHRVIPDFVAQSGDPMATGFGSAGYDLPEETNQTQFTRGVLSMAKDARGVVSGSQFFVTLGPTPHLNDGFTVFGQVTEGLELLDGLQPRDPSEPGQPDGAEIISITIIEGGRDSG